MLALTDPPERTLIDALLAEQRDLSAVGRFARWHDGRTRHRPPARESHYRRLLPAAPPAPGQQYAFEVDLDACSGCKACVTACHSLNGLDEGETWRSVGLLISRAQAQGPNSENRPPFEARQTDSGFQRHVTTACHHCVDPGCLNGCPVLAYDKDPVTGIVRHLDDQCIGCSYCIMKCPYEVPRYSNRLGIVRKCDLCHQRLAVGEAPACVQACPNEAIRITRVNVAEIATRYRPAGAATRNPKPEFLNPPSGYRISDFGFLPDSPNPALTLPTTRYVTKRADAKLVAADHAAPRLDPPHWPLIVMLLLTQTAAGLFVAATVAGAAGHRAVMPPLNVVGFGFLGAGLAASVFHLGQPLKAWRAFLGWRTSWLSRELLAFNAFAALALLAVFHLPATGLAALAGCVAVFASAMVYVDTQRPLWSGGFVLPNFFGTTLLLGAAVAAVVCAFSRAPLGVTQAAVLAALMVRTTLLVWRRWHWRVAGRHEASPIHGNVRTVRALLPWTMPARAWLYVISMGFGLLALVDFARATVLWVSLAALATLSCELLVRYVFFTAAAGRRMPGGIAA